MGVKVGTFTQKTSTGTQAISGLGFAPEMILFFSSGALASGAYEASHRAMYGMSIGTAAGDNGSVSTSSQDAQTTGAHKSTGRAAQKAITFCQYDDTVVAEADLDSIDSDGFTLDWTTADANARIINYIAVTGFDSLKIVEWTMNAASGNQAITGVGFIPDTVINISEQNNVGSATPYVTASGGIGLGAFDDTVEWGLSTFDLESSDVISKSTQSNVDLWAGVTTAGVAKYASFVSMDADGFTINVGAASTPTNKIYSLCLKGGLQVSLATLSKIANQTGSAAVSLGFRPGGLIMAGVNAGAVKATDTDVKCSVGVVDRDDQHTMEFFVDQLATSDVGMVNILDQSFLANDNHDSTIELQSHTNHFNSDGFHINWGSNLVPLTNVGYIAFEEDIANRTGEALKVATGTFAKKTSTGTQAITGIGFTPKIVMCWYTGATADNTWVDFLRQGFGAATSPTNRYAAGAAAEEDSATSNTKTIRSPAHVISIVDEDGTIEGEADLSSFDSDGFTLDWDVANGTAYICHYLALGGDDEIEDAKIVSFVTSTGSGQQVVTGAGFRPDSVLVFGNTRVSSIEDGVHDSAATLLGVTDSLDHRGAQTLFIDGFSYQNARASDIDGFMEGTVTTPSEDLHTVFISMDSDGFTFQNINPSASPGYRIFALCMKGVFTHVDHLTKPVSTTGDQASTGVGFQPVGLFTFGTDLTVDDGVATFAYMHMGAADGTNQNAAWVLAERSANGLQSISRVGKVIVQDDTGGSEALTTTAEGALKTFDSDGFTIDWTTNDAFAAINMYMAFERNWIQSGPLTEKAASASNTLSLIQAASSVQELLRTLTSVIGLGQAARASIFAKSASNVLTLTQLVQQTISFGDVFTPSVENILDLSQTAVLKNAISVSAANILALGHSASNDSIKSHSASSTLAMAQVVADPFKLLSASNTLSLTDVGAGGKNVLESVANVLALAGVVADPFKLLNASSPLSLAQSASAAVDQAVFIPASNSFEMTQVMSFVTDFHRAIPHINDPSDDQALIQLIQTVEAARNHRVAASNTLDLSGAVRLKELTESVTSFLSFEQKAGRVLPTSASNSLFLQQEASRIFKLLSQLNFISSVSPSKGRDANSVLAFTSIATVLSDFARGISQDVGLRQSVGLIHESEFNVECTYSPFVGDVTSGITPPPTTARMTIALMSLLFPAVIIRYPPG